MVARALGTTLCAILIICFILSPTIALSEQAPAPDIDLVRPMEDFVILEPDYPPPSGVPKSYSSSGPEPSWAVVQWNIPGSKLSPFRTQGRTLVSEGDEASVIVDRREGERNTYLFQNGSVLPCADEKGEPRESDLFLSPLGRSGRPGDPGVAESIVLSDMVRVLVSARVSINFRATRVRERCTVNQAGAVVGLVLSNKVVKQTIFYQLTLDNFCGPGPLERVQFCIANKSKSSVFLTTNPYGFSENLTEIATSLPSSEDFHGINIDILPSLKRAVANERFVYLDHILGHWHISGVYIGQMVWGGIIARTKWSNFHLKATLK